MYENLRKQFDYDKWLREEIEKGDKSEYKDLELENFYKDLNAFASAGYLEEFKQLVGYNKDYTDAELQDIMEQTTVKTTADELRQQDNNRRVEIEKRLDALKAQKDFTADDKEEYQQHQELDEVQDV